MLSRPQRNRQDVDGMRCEGPPGASHMQRTAHAHTNPPNGAGRNSRPCCRQQRSPDMKYSGPRNVLGLKLFRQPQRGCKLCRALLSHTHPTRASADSFIDAKQERGLRRCMRATDARTCGRVPAAPASVSAAAFGRIHPQAMGQHQTMNRAARVHGCHTGCCAWQRHHCKAAHARAGLCCV